MYDGANYLCFSLRCVSYSCLKSHFYPSSVFALVNLSFVFAYLSINTSVHASCLSVSVNLSVQALRLSVLVSMYIQASCSSVLVSLKKMYKGALPYVCSVPLTQRLLHADVWFLMQVLVLLHRSIVS